MQTAKLKLRQKVETKQNGLNMNNGVRVTQYLFGGA